jgi:hypothetical protein
MNNPDLSLPQNAGKSLTGRPEKPVSTRQNDRFDSLISRLGREFAIVKQDEQGPYAICPQSDQKTEDMSFDATE